MQPDKPVVLRDMYNKFCVYFEYVLLIVCELVHVLCYANDKV